MDTFRQFLNESLSQEEADTWYKKRQADFERRFAMPVPPIQSVHTKVLVNLLRTLLHGYRGDSVDAFGQRKTYLLRINPNLVSQGGVTISGVINGQRLNGEELHAKGYTEEELRAELATREHIPNKEQARKIRQQQAFGKRNREGQVG